MTQISGPFTAPSVSPAYGNARRMLWRSCASVQGVKLTLIRSATLRIDYGGITVIAPDGSSIGHVPMPDLYTTNICFGGHDLRTAYITLSNSGRLVAVDWPRPGLGLNYLDT